MSNQTISVSELNQIAEKLIELNKEKIVQYLIERNKIRDATRIKMGLYRINNTGKLIRAIEQGWRPEELEFSYAYGNGLVFKAPNGLRVEIIAIPTYEDEIPKDKWQEYTKLVKQYEEKKKKEEELKRLKELEDKLKYYEGENKGLRERLDELENKYETLRKFIVSKGLENEFAEFVKNLNVDNEIEKILEEYGFELEDC